MDLMMIQWSLGVGTIEGKFYIRTAVPTLGSLMGQTLTCPA